ncbi:MAG: class E sortase [Candidatus Nealsonbacteria bacterium]|nr:class E sortase [Candidatus Nealsonbacteria bacterium]
MSEKRFILIAILAVFILISFVLNWKDLSWFFSYHYITYAFENEEPASQNETIYNIANSIEIEKIGISAPLIIPDGTDSTLKEELSQGVVYYPGSVLPGEKGETIILGHSAPSGWPKIKYDWVFNDLNKLEIGDEIVIYFNNQKNVYKVTENNIIGRGEETSKSLTNSINVLTLMSCWPPGKDSKRIAITAEAVIK